jgi:putative ABC transport system permease protein
VSLRRFLHRLLAFARPGRADDELDREIAAHLALLEDNFRRRGASPEEARAAARRAFGSVAATRDRQRDARSLAWLEDARADARYGLRVLRRTPGFTAAAVSTLALGIGASTAIFSVAYGVSMRPLPYPAPGRLVRIYEANVANGQLRHDVSLGAFQAWREGAPAIESAALFGKPATRFLVGDAGAPVVVMSVSPTFFDVVGVRPLHGPGFRPERDYTRRTADTEMVISHAAWQRLFGGRPDAIGQQLVFGGVGDPDAYRVVGIMPEGFAFAEPVDAWKPSQIVQVPVPRLLRQWRYDRVVARLKPGAPIERARAEVDAASARLGAEFPATNGGWSATLMPLHDAIVGGFGRATWLLLAAVGVVLLVACLNVAGLLVARAVARERETAVRVAIGAGPSRLVRLWLAEAMLLSAAGATLGLLLAWWGVAALRAAAPPGIPRLEDVALDLPVLAVTTTSAVLAAIVAALAPLAALRGRRGLTPRLRAGLPGAGDAPSRGAFRTGLTVAQCAGAVALVALAIMLTRSFIKLTDVDPGWDAEGVLSLKVDPPMPPELRRPWARYVEWSDRVIARLEATPGLARAAITTQIPLSTQSHPATLARGRGAAAPNEPRFPCVAHSVSDGYFAAMDIRLAAGRSFGRQDRFSPAQLVDSSTWTSGVAVVTETTARTLWPDRPAIGEAIWLPDTENGKWREVVGVVEDIQFGAIAEAPGLHVFVPWTQYPTGNPRLVVKGTGSGAAIAPLVREVVGAVEPGSRIEQVAALDALVERATAQPRFTSRTVVLFGVVALLLSAVGIHGTLACLVRARTREIGIRLALGASRRDILSRVLRRGLAPAAFGVVIGLALAIAIARAFRALLFEVAPLDPGSLAGGALLLLAIALAAALGPALGASRVDPSTTLRAD